MPAPLGLQKQPPLSLPFIGGVDTRTDPLMLRPPKMAELTNAMFVPGGIQKRPGLAKIVELAYADTGSAFAAGVPRADQTVTAARMLGNRGNELFLVSDGAVYSYAPEVSRWNN